MSHGDDVKHFDSEDYVAWRCRRVVKCKQLAYVVIVFSLIALGVMMLLWK